MLKEIVQSVTNALTPAPTLEEMRVKRNRGIQESADLKKKATGARAEALELRLKRRRGEPVSDADIRKVEAVASDADAEAQACDAYNEELAAEVKRLERAAAQSELADLRSDAAKRAAAEKEIRGKINAHLLALAGHLLELGSEAPLLQQGITPDMPERGKQWVYGFVRALPWAIDGEALGKEATARFGPAAAESFAAAEQLKAAAKKQLEMLEELFRERAPAAVEPRYTFGTVTRHDGFKCINKACGHGEAYLPTNNNSHLKCVACGLAQPMQPRQSEAPSKPKDKPKPQRTVVATLRHECTNAPCTGTEALKYSDGSTGCTACGAAIQDS